jgi:oligoendopeptidase F
LVFDYSSLPREFKRHYLPRRLEFEWGDVSKVFKELDSRRISDVRSLEKWLADEDELNTFLYEQKAIRYINSTRATDNPKFTKAYADYIKNLEPKVKVAAFELLKKYLSSPSRKSLPRRTYGLEDRRRQAEMRVFRLENVELEKQDSTLSQKYQRIAGAILVRYRGKDLTLQQMWKFLEDTDRKVREEAWRLSEARILKERRALDGVYTRMVGLRDRAARNAGFDNYEDFIFVKKGRFDYTPDDCVRFHRAVEEHIVPLSREIDRQRRGEMKLDRLMPWDMEVDPRGREPLSPYTSSKGLVKGALKVLDGVDPQLRGFFSTMVRLELLDLESRKGKAPGGYQDFLAEVRLPFIFMNAAKRDGDVRTLLHEAGHSFHTFLMRESRLPNFNGNGSLPLEFAEVASMSMEVLSGEHYEGSFYDGEGARRSNWDEAVGNVKLFAWIATIDAFQHWVYHHPDHTPEERADAWLKTLDRFCGLESYEGVESSRRYRWQKQLHLFEFPFYYMEYGIALTGALGVWARYRKDRKDAIEAYKGALSLGATKTLPELFEAAGVEWGFGDSAMHKYAGQLRSAIREYSS